VERAYIGIGANLGDREATIGQALELLSARPGVELAEVSRLRETEPWGYADQPAFLNGAAAVDTSLVPLDLLAALLAVERELGRTRAGPRYGPRTIDLDLLLYGQQVIEEPGLAVPHPRLQERAFALEPLLDLDPDLTVPGRGRVADLLAALDSDA
jgi:2-amino-4-hydroxy-6-hydroxymethyldihydropteridine diphosphokinase